MKISNVGGLSIGITDMHVTIDLRGQLTAAVGKEFADDGRKARACRSASAIRDRRTARFDPCDLPVQRQAQELAYRRSRPLGFDAFIQPVRGEGLSVFVNLYTQPMKLQSEADMLTEPEVVNGIKRPAIPESGVGEISELACLSVFGGAHPRSAKTLIRARTKSVVTLPAFTLIFVSLLIGLHGATRIAGRVRNFYVAGNIIPTWVLALSLIGQAIESGSTYGNASHTMTDGFWAGAVSAHRHRTFAAADRLVLRRTDASHAHPDAGDFYQRTYGRHVGTMASLLCVASFIILLASNFAGVGIVLHYFVPLSATCSASRSRS